MCGRAQNSEPLRAGSGRIFGTLEPRELFRRAVREVQGLNGLYHVVQFIRLRRVVCSPPTPKDSNRPQSSTRGRPRLGFLEKFSIIPSLLNLPADHGFPRIGRARIVIGQSVAVDPCGDVRVGMAQSG